MSAGCGDGDLPRPAALDPHSKAIRGALSMAHIVVLRNAQTLGHLGLLPFFALALLAWLPAGAAVANLDAARLAQLALVAYAATILSFLGAVHWGLALAAGGIAPARRRQALAWGVVPSLLGWLALLMMFIGIPAGVVFAFLIADLWLVRLMDGALLAGYPAPVEQYLALRTRLTAGASLALAVAMAAAL
jgi:hypothetical protein